MFYSTKSIPGGEGGAIVTQHKNIYDYLTRYVIYDRFQREMNQGCNIRLSEVQALFLYSVAKESERIILDKQYIVDFYKEICNIKGINYVDEVKLGTNSNFYKFVIIDDDLSSPVLKMMNVTSPIYNYYIDEKCKGLAGVTKIINQHICLPSWYNMDKQLFDSTVKELRNI
jgi:dTDP-4-amino-4,6-dideoxygalactose transaminase